MYYHNTELPQYAAFHMAINLWKWYKLEKMYLSSNYCVLFNEMNKSLIWKFCPLEVNTSTFHYELQMKLLHLNWYCFTNSPWQPPTISALFFMQSRNWAFVREMPRFAGWTQLNRLDDSREGFPGVPVWETDRPPSPLFLSLHPIDVPWKERLQNWSK